jgi:hypothetical protein
LSNVIAIEGAEHGIAANVVLPFGYSRMVTETLGDLDALLEDPASAAFIKSFLDSIAPELVVPIVVYLASRACGLTHQMYSACAGRFARVFVGLAEGWLAERGTIPTVEDMEAHLETVCATDPYTVPGSIFDEVGEICLRVGITG